MEISLLFFEAYLYFGCYFQLCVMLGMLWLLHTAFESFLDDYEANKRKFSYSPALSGFTSSMAWFLAAFIVAFICVSWSLHDYPLALRIVAPPIPLLVYPVLIGYLLSHHDLWGSFGKITWDALSIWKPGGPSFKDGFVTDLLTSLSMALSAVTYSWFRWLDGDKDVISRACRGLWVDPTMCGDHYIVASVVMGLPYLIRFFQCLGEAWYVAPWWYHLLNAAKYLSSIIVIILSGLQSAGIINHTLYSVGFACTFSMCATIWDLVGDWGIHRTPIVNPNLDTVHKWVFYVWVCTTDTLLRFSWAYTWFVKAPYSSFTILTIAILEILRRGQWAYFSVKREEGPPLPLTAPEPSSYVPPQYVPPHLSSDDGDSVDPVEE